MMYLSKTMGNVVETPFEIFKQMVESLFVYHVLDFRWSTYPG